MESIVGRGHLQKMFEVPYCSTQSVDISEQAVMLFFILFICGLSLDVMTASLCTDHKSMPLTSNVGFYAYKKFHKAGLFSCAAECLSTTKCSSFNYCMKTRVCELVREATTTTTETSPTEGCVYNTIDKWPNAVAGPCADHVCPELSVCRVNRLNQASCIHECETPPLVDNAVLTVDGYQSGASASYVCRPNHMSCGTDHQLQCDTSGQWIGSVAACGRTFWSNPDVPFIEPLPCEFKDEYNLRIVGTPTDETRFTINLKQGSQLLLQVDARFNAQGSVRTTVLSSKTGDSWNQAEFLNSFPFRVGEVFAMKLIHSDTNYQVFVNGTFLGAYTDHNPGIHPNTAEVKSSVSLQKVRYS